MRVDYVVDDPGWVQAARRHHLERAVPGLELVERSPRWVARRQRLGRLGGRRTYYFASWRIVRGLHGGALSPTAAACSMASVTSHYNVGGGLDPAAAIPAGTDHGEAFAEAVSTLRGFGVVTVNSMRLLELLGDHVPDLLYLPNGVDTEVFSPPPRRHFDPAAIRVGWVGKVRAAKNFDVVRAAEATLAGGGFEFEVVAREKTDAASPLLDAAALRELYGRIDVYLCTSWHEGTPNPALEAAACGVPLVTTRVGNMPELVRDGENGFFVEPTEESVVARLRSLRTLEEETFMALSRTIRSDVKRDWSWATAGGRYAEAFQRLARLPESAAS